MPMGPVLVRFRTRSGALERLARADQGRGAGHGGRDLARGEGWCPNIPPAVCLREDVAMHCRGVTACVGCLMGQLRATGLARCFGQGVAAFAGTLCVGPILFCRSPVSVTRTLVPAAEGSRHYGSVVVLGDGLGAMGGHEPHSFRGHEPSRQEHTVETGSPPRVCFPCACVGRVRVVSIRESCNPCDA